MQEVVSRNSSSENYVELIEQRGAFASNTCTSLLIDTRRSILVLCLQCRMCVHPVSTLLAVRSEQSMLLQHAPLEQALLELQARSLLLATDIGGNAVVVHLSKLSVKMAKNPYDQIKILWCWCFRICDCYQSRKWN